MTPQQPEQPYTVAVVGLGGVGRALARRMAAAGLTVIGLDNDPAALAALLSGPVGERPHLATRFPEGAAGADAVIEAVPESTALKRAVLTSLRAHLRPGTPVITTALTTPLAELEGAAGADLFALRVLHADALDAVELVRAPGAGDAAAETVAGVLAAAGIAAHAVPDRPGSVAPGLLLGLLNEAAWMVHDGYATAADVDTALRLGCGWDRGPLALLDAIGLDTARDVLTRLADGGDGHRAPAPVLDELIAQGALGRKTGRGFHVHGAGPAARPPAAPSAAPGRCVVVVGSGTMATGIAESCARAGFRTTLLARSAERAGEAAERIAFALQRTADGTSGEPATVRTTADRAVLRGADIVIEAVVEDLGAKRLLFAELGAVCPPHTLLATSTSSLSVAACTEPAGRPADVVGLHFFNPAPVMGLVELVPTPRTSKHTLARARAVVQTLGKEAVRCGDRSGFIVNALLFPYLNRALGLLDRGAATTAELDRVVKAVAGQPLGPVRLLETIGCDVALAVQGRLHAAPGLRADPPAPLLEELVAAGHLGRKTAGKGVRAHLTARAAASAEPALPVPTA
ncbi:3-hydroxyacyl-CoA dehydrogenase family protein [Streptomyces sp. A1277]|uniref:3-hydroxyacyl-CoA dehydrogenase family protein n=1 Tax=Streptomyces sp. A1277 TaxID=2563103 RepID=UPI0010A29BC0|nr:3-hydroxyacyl-CoA dehydrogenase NAD-binding domain-containing protein [Streptomyces sp. A1277]THA36619.1 3-hydroxyacyl-CoA dehydrogenase family protein [Streptomyces sp. A1277]